MAIGLTLASADVRELVAEHKAKLRKSDDHGAYSDDLLVRFWDEIPRHGLDACVTYLETYTSAVNLDVASATVASPMAGTQWARSGTWYGGRISLEWLQGAETGEPKLCLVQVLFKGNRSVADVVTIDGCRYKVTTTWRHKVAAAEALPAKASGVWYERGPVLVDPDTGALSYAIEKHERLYENVPLHTSEIAPGGKTERELHLGVRTGDVDDAGASINLPSMASATAGSVKRLLRSKNADCTQDVEEQLVTPANQLSDDAEERADQTRAANKATQAEFQVTAAAAAGEIQRARNEPTEAGRFRTELETVTAVDQQPSEDEVRHDQAKVVAVHTQKAVGSLPTVPPVPATGEIKIVRLVPTEFKDRVRTEQTTVTATAQRTTPVVEFETKYGTGYYVWAKNQLVGQLASDLATYCVAARSNHPSVSLNEFGLYDYTILSYPTESGGDVRAYGDYEWSFDIKVNGYMKTRTVSVKWYSASSGSAAAAWVSASNAPGADKFPVGPMWKAIKVVDS